MTIIWFEDGSDPEKQSNDGSSGVAESSTGKAATGTD